MKEELTYEKRISYTQVLEVLNNMEKENVDKIPIKLIEFFENNSDKEYNFKLKPGISLRNQNLTEYALALLAMLNINYWCKDESEKKALIDKYSENERKYQEELRIKYNPDNLFKKNNEVKIKEKINNDNLPIRLTWYEKMISKLKSIFRKDNI